MKPQYIKFSELSPDEQKLLQTAKAVMGNAYNIYSSFFVGAAVLTSKGRIYNGACMENASYGLTLCAEVGAIQSAFSAGDREITTIAVCGGNPDDSNGETVTPCGRCRQIIYEASQLAGNDINVILSNASLDKIIKLKISELLPLAFGPSDLGLDDEIIKFRNK
jgi:cytidine deaminase